MQPDGSRAWTSIEREHQRPLGGRAIECIRHEENVGLDLASFVVAERHVSGGRGISQGLAGKLDLVMGDDRRFFLGKLFGLGLAGLFWSLASFLARLTGLGGFLLLSTQRRETNDERDEKGDQADQPHPLPSRVLGNHFLK